MTSSSQGTEPWHCFLNSVLSRWGHSASQRGCRTTYVSSMTGISL